MEIKVGKKGKIILKAENGEFLRIVPKHLPSFRKDTFEISCDEFEITVENLKLTNK